MNRYSVISEGGFPREFLLLQGTGCRWRQCSFCDYHSDAGPDPFSVNKPVLEQVEALAGAHFDFIAAHPRLPMFILNEIHLNEERRKTYLPVLVEALRDTIRDLDALLGQALSRDEVRPTRTVDLLFSMAALNVMTFAGLPIAREAFGMDDEGVRQFVARRRAENIEMVLSRLRK